MSGCLSADDRLLIDEAVAAGRVSHVSGRRERARADRGERATAGKVCLGPAMQSVSGHGPVSSCGKRLMSVRAVLEWAFGVERAALDFDEVATVSGSAQPHIGMEYIMIERAKLGMRPDGGGRSDPHADAEIVASALAALPVALGGRGMAAHVAGLAQAGLAPDWMEGARPRCVPVTWRGNQVGPTAATESVGRVEYIDRGRKRVRDVRMCPVTYVPTPSQIAAARRGYLDWWSVLWDIRVSFQIYGGLSSVELTDAMPEKEPWRKKAS